MTKRDLFRLIIKIFGLYAVISTMFSVFPNNIFFVAGNTDLVGIVWLIVSLAVVLMLVLFLIYNPDKIIDWLHLDKDFDEERIDFQNFNTAAILKLAVVVIGGLLLIHNVPIFLSNTLFAFKTSVGSSLVSNNMIQYGSTRDYINWAVSFINIVIGYFMLTNYTFFSKILKEKEPKE
jgi:hypothetical protein